MISTRETGFSSALIIRTADDLDDIVDRDDSIQEVVEAKKKFYYSINISEAMTQLTTVGKLLRVAQGASVGFSCSKPIVSVISNYQTMIKNSCVTSGEFVDASFHACKNHVLALKFAEKGSPDKALILLGKTAGLADKMAKTSGQLVEQAQSLCNQSHDAIMAAFDDHSVSAEQKRELKKTLAEIKAKEAELQQKTKDLAKQVQEERKKEEDMLKQAKEAKEKSFILSAAGAVAASVDPSRTSAITCVNKMAKNAKKEAKTAAKAAEPFGAKRRELQEAQLEANAELAKAVSKLDSLSVEDNYLEKALTSLELAYRTMGKVKTVFENTRLFWLGVKNHCETLAALPSDELELIMDLEEEFIAAIKDSGMSWLTIGRINRAAYSTIQDVDKSVDKVMTSLCGRREARKLIPSLVEEIKTQLALESSEIKEVQKLEEDAS